jgi:hypothetical protein
MTSFVRKDHTKTPDSSEGTMCVPFGGYFAGREVDHQETLAPAWAWWASELERNSPV